MPPSSSSSLSSLTLSVSTGSPPNVVTYEQDIHLANVNMGNNSIMIPNNSSMVTAFETAFVGTSFSYSIKASYADGLSVVTANGDQPFVIPPPPPIALGTNYVTVKYILTSIPSGPTPAFYQANPRGTGKEWFAVVDQSFKQKISDYANTSSINYAAAVATFTPPGQSTPVVFNNIVTTLMTDMSYMFNGNSIFNQPIGSWDVSNVNNMSYMFMQAFNFNQDISNWNVSNVYTMEWMFYQAYFFNNNGNSNIGFWNTFNVQNMSTMFHDAWAFNQNISMWPVSNVTNHSSFKGGQSNLNQAYVPFWVYL